MTKMEESGEGNEQVASCDLKANECVAQTHLIFGHIQVLLSFLEKRLRRHERSETPKVEAIHRLTDSAVNRHDGSREAVGRVGLGHG